MKYILLSLILTSISSSWATSKLEDPIFNDEGRTFAYLAQFQVVKLEIKIRPANGSSPEIHYKDVVSSKEIPNTLKQLYVLFPSLQSEVREIMPDNYYVKIEESLSESENEKGCIKSFIGAYAHEIKGEK